MATSAALIAAAQDDDLLRRAVALAASLGVENPQAFVESRRHELAAAGVDEAGATIASVYEYAASQPRYRVGEDPSAITDDHLRTAIENLSGRVS